MRIALADRGMGAGTEVSMRLVVREETVVETTPEAVWRVLADPARRGEWNEKIVRVERARGGVPRVGERYRLGYRLGRHEREMDAEVEACEAPLRLAVRERPARDPDPARSVLLTWRVEPVGGGVRIVQLVDISHAPMAWPIKLLMWIMARIGKPQGATVVETLGELVLTEPTPQ